MLCSKSGVKIYPTLVFQGLRGRLLLHISYVSTRSQVRSSLVLLLSHSTCIRKLQQYVVLVSVKCTVSVSSKEYAGSASTGK